MEQHHVWVDCQFYGFYMPRTKYESFSDNRISIDIVSSLNNDISLMQRSQTSFALRDLEYDFNYREMKREEKDMKSKAQHRLMYEFIWNTLKYHYEQCFSSDKFGDFSDYCDLLDVTKSV